MSETHIDIKNNFIESILNNKIILVISVTYLVGSYLQDVVFTKAIAKVTSNVTDFIDHININKLIMLLLPYIVALLLFYLSNSVAVRVIPKIELEVINKTIDQVIDSNRTTNKSINVNEIMMHIKNIYDTQKIYKLCISCLIPTLIIIIALVYNVITVDISSGLIIILIIMVLIIITAQLEADTIDNVYKSEKANLDMYEDIHDVLNNIDTIVLSDTKKKEMTNIANTIDIAYKAGHKAEKNNIDTSYLLLFLTLAVILGINYITYRLYKNGSINSTVLLSNVLLSILFMDYYDYCIKEIMNNIIDVGKLLELNTYFSGFNIIKNDSIDTFHNKETNNEETNKLKLDKQHNLIIKNGDITFSNISLNYDKKNIFENLNLQIKGNKKTGIIGPIGSGKSSLLKILVGAVKYTGDVYVDGQNLKDHTYESIVKNIAYISQHPKLFNKTIMYNLNYGTKYSDKEVIKKLDDMGLLSFFNNFPDGLNTKVGKEGSFLSGGQKQFVALLRSILQNKPILLLDEPTSSLDTKSRNIFMDIIKKLHNKTIIVSTHDPQISKIFDRIIDIDNYK